LAAKKRKKIYILYYVVAVIIIAIFYLCVLRPKCKHILFLSSKVKTKIYELTKAVNSLGKKDIILRQIEEISKKNSLEEQSFFTKVEIDEFLKDLKKTGSIDFQTENLVGPEDVFCEVSLTVRFKCDYYDFVNYIKKIENLKKFLKISKIEIQNFKENCDMQDILLQIKLYGIRE